MTLSVEGETMAKAKKWDAEFRKRYVFCCTKQKAIQKLMAGEDNYGTFK